MTRRRDGLRRAARSATLLLVAALLFLVAGGPAAAAGARVAPDDDYAGRLEFDVATVDPVLVTTAGPTSVTVTGTVTNTGAEPITDLIYRFQRGPAVTSTAELQRELNEPSEPTAAVPPRFSALLDRLDPGQSAPFTATVPLTGTGGIGVQTPGVYPLLLNVNGDVTLEAGPLPARVGELHLVLPVLGVPGGSDPVPAPGRPLGVSVLWPLIDTPHLAVGGVFRNDDLAGSIAPGGRLATLLDGLTGDTSAALPAGSVTLVLDPQLLDELDRMSRGYQVLTGPQTPLALTTPDQAGPADTTAPDTTAPDTTAPDTTAPDTDAPDTDAPQTTPATATTAGPANGSAPATASAPPTSVNPALPSTSASTSPSADQVGVAGNAVAPGTGSAAAAEYLQRLRSAVGRYPTVLLPLADPDAVSLTRSGLGDDVAATTAGGREIATRVLGGEVAARLITTTAYPAQGLLDGPTADVLTAAGFSGAVLSASGVGDSSADDGRSTAVTLTGPDGADLGLRAAVAQAGGLGDLALLAGQESGRNWSIRVNALTGLLYQQVKDDAAQSGGDDRTPRGTVIVPNRQWSPSLASLQRLEETLVTLGRGGLVTGVDLRTVLDQATASAPLDYPDSARSDELDPAYLDDVRVAREEIGQLRSAFGDQPQSQDPGPVLDALDASLLTAGSTAYRTQFAGAEANLTTVRSTLDELHAGVRIATSGATYTLASSSSPLLVTVQNTLPYDVTVTVRIVGGEYVGLDATAPDPQVVPAGRSVPFRIATEVSRSGQFQVSAQVVGADGAVWGETVPLSVQSSAFGAVTVVIIAVAGAVLLIMVVLRVRQRMQLRRARIAAQAAGLPWPPVSTDQGGDPVLGEVRR